MRREQNRRLLSLVLGVQEELINRYIHLLPLTVGSSSSEGYPAGRAS